MEDTPVRDSAGSLPPGVTRVRESLNSTGEIPTAALLGTQGKALLPPALPPSPPLFSSDPSPALPQMRAPSWTRAAPIGWRWTSCATWERP